MLSVVVEYIPRQRNALSSYFLSSKQNEAAASTALETVETDLPPTQERDVFLPEDRSGSFGPAGG